MSTLSRAITAQWLSSAEQYQALRSHWRKIVTGEQRHQLRAEHHLLYSALLGKDWRRGFTPVRNTRKLENGMRAHMAIEHAVGTLHSQFAAPQLLAPFAGLVTQEMLGELRAHMPGPHAAMSGFTHTNAEELTHD